MIPTHHRERPRTMSRGRSGSGRGSPRCLSIGGLPNQSRYAEIPSGTSARPYCPINMASAMKIVLVHNLEGGERDL
jgi:hypothetical protein